MTTSTTGLTETQAFRVALLDRAHATTALKEAGLPAAMIPSASALAARVVDSQLLRRLITDMQRPSGRQAQSRSRLLTFSRADALNRTARSDVSEFIYANVPGDDPGLDLLIENLIGAETTLSARALANQCHQPSDTRVIGAQTAVMAIRAAQMTARHRELVHQPVDTVEGVPVVAQELMVLDVLDAELGRDAAAFGLGLSKDVLEVGSPAAQVAAHYLDM